MDELNALQSLGFVMPSPTYLFGAVFFGIVGYAAYRHGKKSALPIVKWIGIVLMLYPYAVSSTWLLYAIGCALCLGAYLYRR